VVNLPLPPHLQRLNILSLLGARAEAVLGLDILVEAGAGLAAIEQVLLLLFLVERHTQLL
jgi:hypothetical protein